MDTRPVRRLANNIETLKSLLLVLTVLATVGGMMGGSPGIAIIFAIYGVISGISIYVFFGLLEHTVRLLTGIAYNTAFSAGVMTDPKESGGPNAFIISGDQAQEAGLRGQERGGCRCSNAWQRRLARAALASNADLGATCHRSTPHGAPLYASHRRRRESA